MPKYFVYILTNKTFTLYVGVTGNLIKRLHQHTNTATDCFTARYKINKLIYFETYNDVREAISREKQIKGWIRKKKIALVKTVNPNFADLSELL